ncbi:hypothetical protein C8J56DRAFT_960068 [Mycena floridula]|nr:hypothetical protein C8J56DRAFT_960068 [Mycena floridula]
MPDWERLSIHCIESLRLDIFGHFLASDTAQLWSFVSRHQTVSHLVLLVLSLEYHTLAPFHKPIDFLNLITYRGISANILGSCPQLRSLNLIGQDLDALDRGRLPRCQDLMIFMENETEQAVQDIFNSVTQRLPDLQYFFLNSEQGINLSAEQGCKSLVDEGLSGLRKLESFGLFMREHSVITEDLDSLINSWVKICPTLQECLLIQDLHGTASGYGRRVVDGKVQPTEACQIERLFRIQI